MSRTTAEATINTLRTVYAIHGLPEELVTDNGAQFIVQVSRISSEVPKQSTYIIEFSVSSSSQRQAERAVKIFYQSMKVARGDSGTPN